MAITMDYCPEPAYDSIEDILNRTLEIDMEYLELSSADYPFPVFFGELLSIGAFTAVFKIKQPYKISGIDLSSFKDPVLIISTEKIKPSIYEEISGQKVFRIDSEHFKKLYDSHKENWLKEHRNLGEFDIWNMFEDIDLNPLLYMISEELDSAVYIAEKIEKIEVSTDICQSFYSLISKECDICPDVIYWLEDIKKKLENFEFSNLDQYISELLQNSSEKEYFEEIVFAATSALRKSTEIALKEGNAKLARVDIHELQFVKQGEHIKCIDPLVYFE